MIKTMVWVYDDPVKDPYEKKMYKILFKLFRNKDKIDHGRLLKTDGYLKFISEKLFNNKDLMLDNKMIVYFSKDSI